jgi:hypothetical protein
MTQLCIPLFLGLNPYYWQFSRMTDSEMPIILWSLIALLLAEIGWSSGMIRHRAAIASGLVCGFGMLIRGSFFGALFLPLTYVLVRRPAHAELRLMTSRYGCYAVGFALPFLGWMLRNRSIDVSAIGYDGINQIAMVFRENPVDPSSPFRGVPQIFAEMLTNLKWYVIYVIPKSIVPGLWSPAAWDHLGRFSAPVAVLVSATIVILSCFTMRNLPIIFMYASMAALNLFYAYGSMERLWVPVTCLMAVSLPISIESLPILRQRTVRPLVAAAVVGAMAISLVCYVQHHDQYPYHDPDYSALAGMFADIRDQGVVEGDVLTPNADAFGLYTGRSAPMSVPGIGIDPAYQFVILRTNDWVPGALGGTSVYGNGVWSLIRLSTPMSLSQIKENYTNWRSSRHTASDQPGVWPWFICQTGSPSGC